MSDIKAALIDHFKEFGMSETIKVDNGRPFGDPQRELIPLLALWLIGLGVKVIHNRPRQPTDNAKVERGQAVLANWVEPHKCLNIEDLSKKLKQEALYQRETNPVQRLGGKTRIQAFPAIKTKGRAFNEQDFDLNKVLLFIATGHWNRLVSTNGQISFWGKRIHVGTKYAHQQVSIRLDEQNNQWTIFNIVGDSIKKSDTPFSAKSICNLEFDDCQ